MTTEVILPMLGETVNESVIVEWFKKEGDPVRRGDVLFSVESDKAILEVEASTEGVLRRILVPAGAKVPVLTVVALIAGTADEPLPGDMLPSVGPVSDRARPLADEGRGTVERPAPAEAQPEVGRPFASPRARKAARQEGVDLAQVAGSGPGGRIVERDVLGFLAAPRPVVGAAQPKVTPVGARAAEGLGVDLAFVRGTGPGGQITRADVEAAAEAAKVVPTRAVPPEAASVAAAPPAVPSPLGRAVGPEGAGPESIPMTGLRRIIAERMAASHHTTARVTLMTEADATAFVEARDKIKAAVSEEWGFAPGYNDLLALIVARALREFPNMNARLSADGQAIERLPVVNLGLAVDTERGLLVPVLRNADQKGLRTLGSEFRTLVERARAGKALPDDLTGGTFTLTNLGMFDVDAFTPIINLPEAAILGVGRIQPKAVVRDGQIVARQMWALSLAFDHRLVDGAPAARFLQRIKQLVESPTLLLA